MKLIRLVGTGVLLCITTVVFAKNYNDPCMTEPTNPAEQICVDNLDGAKTGSISVINCTNKTGQDYPFCTGHDHQLGPDIKGYDFTFGVTASWWSKGGGLPIINSFSFTYNNCSSGKLAQFPAPGYIYSCDNGNFVIHKMD